LAVGGLCEGEKGANMSFPGFTEISERTLSRFESSPLGKMAEGKTFEKPPGEYDKPMGALDDNNKQYMENGELMPDNTYVLNGNEYRTDDLGRIISCESTPERTPDNARDISAQVAAGSEHRQSNDHGGHIVARDLGGDGGAGNLVALDSRINLSDYKRMENDIKDALDEGQAVSVKTNIEYSGSSERPDRVTATVTADGKDTIYTFDNNMDGALMGDLKENLSKSDVAVVNDVLYVTGGTVSSIKEELNLEGKLEKTKVSITSTSEDGSNYRRQVVIDHDGGVRE